MISCFDVSASTSRGVLLFDEISFELEGGGWVEWMGPPGAGKSVLFSMLTLQRPPPAGRLLVAGRHVGRLDPDDRAALRRRIGSCAQPPRLLADRSIRTHLSLPMVARRQEGRADQKIDELLETMELEYLGELSLSDISYGEQAMVGVLQATIGSPDIIALDDTLSDLGPTLRDRALDRLRHCWERGSLVLLFSRNPSGRAPSDSVRFQLRPPEIIRTNGTSTHDKAPREA